MAPTPKPQAPAHTGTFEISVVGETTGQTYTGTFTAKNKLSKLDVLNADRLFSEYLGNRDPARASPQARVLAQRLADLGVRLTGELPAFWVASNLGEQLFDDNVLLAVYDGAMGVELAFLKELKEKALRSQQVLRDQATLGDGESPSGA